LQRIQEHLKGLEKEESLALALRSLVNLQANSYNEHLANGYLVFHTMFHDVTSTKGKKVDASTLKAIFDTSLGKVEKDYHKYLPYTRFPYDLGESVYKKLLEQQRTKYKRKEFKRVCTHFIAFCNKTHYNYPTIFNLILSICKEKKIVLTLLEFYYLATMNDIKFTKQEFSSLIGVVSSFKYYNEDVIFISKQYAKANNCHLTVDMLEHYIDMLILNKKTDTLMFTLDRMKENIDDNTFNLDPKLSSEENTKAEEAHSKNQQFLIKSLFKNFLTKLVASNLKSESSLIYNEISKRGWIESTNDFINGIKISVDSPENFENIVSELLKVKGQPSFIVTTENLIEILKCIK